MTTIEEIQKEFNDFIESSKEIEKELEVEIENLNIKLNELQKKYIANEDKLKLSNDKCLLLSNENNKVCIIIYILYYILYIYLYELAFN